VFSDFASIPTAKLVGEIYCRVYCGTNFCNLVQLRVYVHSHCESSTGKTRKLIMLCVSLTGVKYGSHAYPALMCLNKRVCVTFNLKALYHTLADTPDHEHSIRSK
jgi:hypothetical protein